MIITPDLKQNIFYALFFTITHNALALFYFCGMLVAIGLSLYRPSRKSIFLLLGFSLLLFGFEYNKHILEGLREQTLNALITIQEHNKVRRIINIITLKLLPFFLPVAGWGLVLLSGFLFFKEQKRKN
ncbi:hypothetical protein HZC27_04475 [Candidatus Roizmanbacteria bacterium]|nr:hypothetical protein [Candidatus Roizmanbacteria bacterium]